MRAEVRTTISSWYPSTSCKSSGSYPTREVTFHVPITCRLTYLINRFCWWVSLKYISGIKPITIFILAMCSCIYYSLTDDRMSEIRNCYVQCMELWFQDNTQKSAIQLHWITLFHMGRNAGTYDQTSSSGTYISKYHHELVLN